MKKLLLCLAAVSSLTAFSQISMQVTSQGNNIPSNGTISAVTNASATCSKIIDIKNTSNSPKSYVVKRYDILLYADATSTAEALFCFAGSCYGSGTMVSPTPLTLGAGQSASQSTLAFNMLTADLNEANSIGLSIVKYTFANTSTASDSLQFTITYNQPTGISENNNIISSFDVFPNPVNENAAIKINCAKAADGKFCIYNALGAMVSEKSISLNEGRNKIEFNAETFPSGIYFANIKFGNSSSTKKFIVK